jgi:hypothetical protein
MRRARWTTCRGIDDGRTSEQQERQKCKDHAGIFIFFCNAHNSMPMHGGITNIDKRASRYILYREMGLDPLTFPSSPTQPYHTWRSAACAPTGARNKRQSNDNDLSAHARSSLKSKADRIGRSLVRQRKLWIPRSGKSASGQPLPFGSPPGGGPLSDMKLKKLGSELTLGLEVGLPRGSSHTPRRPRTAGCSHKRSLD